ncbi:unnamed protein product [Paramecium pentaurelia]|uniref:Uncharacterized protein n=1 Tax=Paramecium pentaurelia TaxID=43138 RepID=A0A8S1SR58_9CILI|nr:unnamed protein product [Paramecium pentaurelia]
MINFKQINFILKVRKTLYQNYHLFKQLELITIQKEGNLLNLKIILNIIKYVWSAIQQGIKNKVANHKCLQNHVSSYIQMNQIQH